MDRVKVYLGLIPYSPITAFGEAEDKAAKEKADADKVVADKKIADDKIAADKIAADKIEADKIAAEKAKPEKKTEVVIKVEVPKVEKGKTYTAEETEKLINDAVKAGAVTAKNQLHDEIDKLKGDIKATEEAIKRDPESSKLKGENIELSAKLKILEEEITKVVVKGEQLEQSLIQKDLDAYKKKVIETAKGKIVPEIVSGTTEAEIDASAELAVKKYEEYSEKVRKDYNLPKVPDKSVEEGAGEVTVERIDPRNPASIKAWEAKKKETTDAIWKKYLRT